LLYKNLGGGMPIQLDWVDDTQTALVYTFENKWTWDDFFAAWGQAHVIAEASPYKINVIADFTRSMSLPENILSIARSVDKKVSASTGTVIVVGATPFLIVMIDIMRKSGIRAVSQIYSFKTMLEALNLLASQQSQHDQG
jgi:hypothetical protein